MENFVKDFPKNKWKYLSQEICGKEFESIKYKVFYTYKHMCSFERFSKRKSLGKKKFVARSKMSILMIKIIDIL